MVNQSSKPEDGEEWLNSVYIWEGQPTGFSDGLDIFCKMQRGV